MVLDGIALVAIAAAMGWRATKPWPPSVQARRAAWALVVAALGFFVGLMDIYSTAAGRAFLSLAGCATLFGGLALMFRYQEERDQRIEDLLDGRHLMPWRWPSALVYVVWQVGMIGVLMIALRAYQRIPIDPATAAGQDAFGIWATVPPFALAAVVTASLVAPFVVAVRYANRTRREWVTYEQSYLREGTARVPVGAL